VILIRCPWHFGKVPAVRLPYSEVWVPMLVGKGHHYTPKGLEHRRAWVVAFHRVTEEGHRAACKGSRNLIAVVDTTTWPTDEVTE
jgi:hypothetical protein